MNKKIPKIAIFDMDGIIFNTEELFMNKKNIFLEKYGYAARKEDYVRTIGTRGDTLLKILNEIYGEDYPAEEISELTRESVRKHIEKNGLEIKPGIPELLEFLKENNVICMVASSTTTSTVEHYLGISGLNQYFDTVIGGDMVSNSKPDPEIFLKAYEEGKSLYKQRYNMDENMISKENAIIIEDSENGILAAKAAGIAVICIPDLVNPNGAVRDIPVYIASSAYDVIEYFA